jgi:DNA-nicking Smr family endonuclease
MAGKDGDFMDMGDILAQWDDIKKKEKQAAREAKKQPQVSHKKANAPTAQEKELAQAKKTGTIKEKQAQINPMEYWLNRYGTVDKDKIAEETVERTRQQDREYVLNMKPEAYLDLHGLHQDEARIRLDSFVSDCKRRGLRKIMVIHGKGIHTHGTDPVLGEVVRRYIESDPRCGTSGHPKNKADGGTGATWIILK